MKEQISKDEAYRYENSKGVTYFLNVKGVELRGGKTQDIWFFTKDYRPETAVRDLPKNFAINENPRNGFLTVKRLEDPIVSVEVSVDTSEASYEGEVEEDCDDCACCCDCTEDFAAERQNEGQKLEERREGKLDKCVGPVCSSDASCCDSCDDTEEVEIPVSVAREIVEKLRDFERDMEEKRKASARPTMRRTLVEEIKSYTQSYDGKVGESNTVVVSYEYDAKKDLVREFNTVTKPVQAIVDMNDAYSFRQGKVFNRLELEAYIKNLQTILNTLE